MEGYGIQLYHERRGLYRFKVDGVGEWESPTAAESLAYWAFTERSLGQYVTFGNGHHEFRMWRDGIDSWNNFTHPDARWAEWYVDVEISGHRWRYRPVADLDDLDAAEELADEAHHLPGVTRVWIGKSDGSEEYETITQAD